MKNLKYLNSTSWYRALKVVYGVFIFSCYTVACLSIVAVWMKEKEMWFIIKLLYIPWSFLWAYIVSKVPQLLFYYIYFGSVRPHHAKEDENAVGDNWKNMTEQELNDAFNKEVRNPAWTTSRGKQLIGLHNELKRRGYDLTSVESSGALSFENKVKLMNNKVYIL